MPRNRVYTSADGLIARAGRALEDPAEMTRAANDSRIARYRARVLEKNPDLTPDQADRAARLLIRADMARLGRRSGAARKAAAGGTA